jgi:arylsulfatase
VSAPGGRAANEFKGVIGRTVETSTPWWPPAPQPPGPSPNIVFIVLDDVGFSDLGCFGSEIHTPNMDRLAARGLRYTNFHTTAVCSSSRACLLTGRNHHSVGMAAVSNWDMGFPGSRGRVARSAGNLAEMLRPYGYGTFITGKWHLTPLAEATPAGPYDEWPLSRGFERFYGNFAGDNNWVPMNLVYDNHRTLPPERPDYHLSDDIVDRAIEFIRDQVSIHPEKPFFLYTCFRACHSPYHAPPEFLARYRGVFDDGWDECRARRLERMKELGIVPASTELGPRNADVPAWDELSEGERRLCTTIQEAYAAMLDHADANIGRLLAFIDKIGKTEDTMVVLLSDNGATREGGTLGASNAMRWNNALPPLAIEDELAQLERVGGPLTYPVNAKGWSMVGNTPLKRYKSTTHGGGIRDPMIVSWPARITDHGSLRTQFSHLVDVVPTVLELLEIEPPAEINGVAQQPIEGVSFAHTFASATAPTNKQAQYFEMMGNRGIWHEGWKAVSFHEPHTSFDDDVWELYHLDEDMGEQYDLATEMPEKLRQMVDLWWAEAGKHNVLPLDDRILERFLVSPPSPVTSRNRFVYYPGAYIPGEVMPNIKNISYTITAQITRPSVDCDGVIVSCGDATLGYSLYVKDGRLAYHYNAAGDHSHVVAEPQLPVGPCTVRFEFTKTGELEGTGALFVDDKPVGETHLGRTIGVTFTHLGLMIGSGRGTPVADDYVGRFPFQGEIDTVVYELGDDREVVKLPDNVHNWTARGEKM